MSESEAQKAARERAESAERSRAETERLTERAQQEARDNPDKDTKE